MTTHLNNPELKEREVEGLLEAMKAYDLQEGLILTENEESTFQIDQYRISVLPIWKWLLNQR